MTLDIQPLLQWITLHPTWSGWIILLISLSESLAIVGIVVPGVLLMTAIGSLIGAGKLPALETMTWAILGAIAGDGISYWLGYHFHEKLKKFWPFNQFPVLLERGSHFFESHGGKSIILGRFVGPIRPTIPVIAGMMGMTPMTFLVFNILSAIAWAPLYCLPGILIGASLGQLSPEIATRLGFLVLCLLLFLWLLFSFILKLLSKIAHFLGTLLDHLWHAWQRSPRFKKFSAFFEAAPTSSEDLKKGQFGTALLFLLSSACFGLMVTQVIQERGLFLLNEPVYHFLRALYSAPWVKATTLFTSLATPCILAGTIAVTGLWLFVQYRKRLIVFFWIGIPFLGTCIGEICKRTIDSPRPEGLAQIQNGASFPSGHTLLATLLFGLTAILAHQRLPRQHRWIPWSIALPFVLLIAFSRLYLGVHWLTDVIGGLSLGLACITLGLFIYRHLESQTPAIRHFILPSLITLLLTASVYNLFTYSNTLEKLERSWPIETLDKAEWWKEQYLFDPLYRTGPLKKQATFFDVQWLGALPDIEQTLANHGWVAVPRLSWKSALMLFASDVNGCSVPALPKFHNERLPRLVFTKPLTTSPQPARIVLQLWASDYVTENNLPLWVGTVRVEYVKHLPLILISWYQENPQKQAGQKKEAPVQFLLKDVQQNTSQPVSWRHKRLILPHPLFLIAPK